MEYLFMFRKGSEVMAFSNEITQFTTETTTHADNFNNVHNKLLDNDKDLLNQINVLSGRDYLPVSDNRNVATKPSDYKLKFTFSGLKSSAVTGLPTWAHVFGVNAYSGIDGFTNAYEYAFCDGMMYIRSQYPLNTDTWGDWQQLATKADTDVLGIDRGYVGSKDISGLDLDTIFKNGKYSGNNLINAPSLPVAGHSCILEVSDYNGGSYYCQQKLSCLGKTWERFRNGGSLPSVWTKWAETATTTKTDISSYLVNGWTIPNASIGCYMVITGNSYEIVGCLLNTSTTSPTSLVANGLPNSTGKIIPMIATGSDLKCYRLELRTNGALHVMSNTIPANVDLVF